MRNLPLAAVALLASIATQAQSPAPAVGCDSPESHQMDFWLGEWHAEYVMKGVKGASHNRITKTLDGCAILEEFTGAPGLPLDGRSYSVYDRNAGVWKQTWVDNQGGYLDFTGGVVDGNRIFARETGQPLERIEEDTHRNFWLSAETAVRYGLVGRIISHASELDG